MSRTMNNDEISENIAVYLSSRLKCVDFTNKSFQNRYEKKLLFDFSKFIFPMKNL